MTFYLKQNQPPLNQSGQPLSQVLQYFDPIKIHTLQDKTAFLH